MFGSLYNKIGNILEGVVMSKKNFKSLTKSPLNPVKVNNRLPYNQPKLHYLGALEQMQGNYQGRNIDASGRYYV